MYLEVNFISVSLKTSVLCTLSNTKESIIISCIPVYISTNIHNLKNLWSAVLLFMHHFLISRTRFLDIKKWILDIKKYFLISRNIFLKSIIRFLDIKKLYQEIIQISWYQKIEFLISRNVFWGAVSLFIKYFLISRIWFLDTKKWNSWYQEFDFLLSRNIDYFLRSRNRILDIKKCWINSAS